MTPNVRVLADLCRAITHPEEADDRREWDDERSADVISIDRHYGDDGG